MPAVDLDADLIPGTSAAGWRIGARLSECNELVQGATEAEYQPGFHLNDAISANVGLLVVRNYFPLGSGSTSIFFGADIVRFDFNGVGELFCVSTYEGYRGRAFARIEIGSPFEMLQSLFPLIYDNADEMYYPDQGRNASAPSGIAFLIDQTQPNDGRVVGICVHDWALMRRTSRPLR